MELLIKPNAKYGKVVIPGSKSLTHRALICAALSKQKVTIYNANICEDTMITLALLQNIGAEFNVDKTTITVLPPNTFTKPREIINAHNSGTSVRFMGPIYYQLFHEFKVIIDKRMYERLLLTTSDSEIDIKINNETEHEVCVNISFNNLNTLINNNKTTQYTSGILLSTIINQNDTYNIDKKILQNPYVQMTLRVMQDFHYHYTLIDNTFMGTHPSPTIQEYYVEGDYSNASNFLVMGCLNGNIKCVGLTNSSIQGDCKIIDYLKMMNAKIERDNMSVTCQTSNLKPVSLDLTDTPDLIPLLMAVLSVTPGMSKITGFNKLIYKETNRLEMSLKILNELGASISLENDTIIILGKKKLNNPSYLELPTDHRLIMMVIAIASCFTNPITITNIQAIDKSYKNFINDFIQLRSEYENY